MDRRELEFQLFEVLDTLALTRRPRFQGHSRATLTAVTDTFLQLAQQAGTDAATDPSQLLDGRAGPLPETLMILGNAFFAADPASRGRALFNTRSGDLVTPGFSAILGAQRHYHRVLDLCRDPGAGDPAVTGTGVRRRLLAQKAWCEGGMALCLFAARLTDDHHTPETEAQGEEAGRLLEFLDPLIRHWPRVFARSSERLADQLQAAGSGATTAAESMSASEEDALARDLLGKRVWHNQSQGLQLLLQALQKDLEAATTPDGQQWALSLSETLQRAVQVTQTLGKALGEEDPEAVLANGACYLHLFGHIVVAWMWLRQANAAALGLGRENEAGARDFYQGKLQAARYFFHWELPLVAQDLVLLNNRDDTCLAMRPEWF